MLQIRDDYDEDKGGSYGWFGYMNKGNHSENGLYLSKALRNRITEDYQNLYEQYVKIIKQLKVEGFKVIYCVLQRKSIVMQGLFSPLIPFPWYLK